MRFDHKKFFAGVRAEWYARNGMSQSQVNGLSRLLAGIEADPYVKDVRWAAYMLATSKHETADTFQPIHEYGGKSYFIRRYGGNTRKGRELGNDTAEEGYYYAGKGDVQLTGETNYEKAEDDIRREYPELVARFEKRTGRKFDLTVGDQPNDTLDPQNALDPEVSYAVMSYGMRHGRFTGKKLIDYFHGRTTDYSNARRIINGLDRYKTIATYAEKFEKILRASLVDNKVQELAEEGPPIESETVGEPTGNTVTAEITPLGGVKVETTSNGTPAPKERIAVVKATPEKWYQSIGAKVTTFVTGNALFQWLWGQVQSVSELGIPWMVWVVLTSLIALGGLIWIISSIVEVHGKRRVQAEIDKLLVTQNSTPDNLAQLIPADEIELYRAKGFKIITRGEQAPTQSG